MTDDLRIEEDAGAFSIIRGDARITLEVGEAINLAQSIQALALQFLSGPQSEKSSKVVAKPHAAVERFSTQADLLGHFVHLRLFALGTELGYGMAPDHARLLAAKLVEAASKADATLSSPNAQ